jgi:3-phosphoshikimate 1-carboxyvinyltransferase
MTALIVHPAHRPLTGSVPVPSDRSIGRLALLIGALSHGETYVSGLTPGEDSSSIARSLRAMGVAMSEVRPGELLVQGAGLEGLRAPGAALECERSGTTIHLLCGVLAAQPFRATLAVDATPSLRRLMPVVTPLRARGARIDGRPHPTCPGEITAPLIVGPLAEGRRLASLEYESPVASAQVKSAVLLSGLFADGVTIFKEPTVSRDHTERMLDALGVPIRTAGSVVQLEPGGWDGRIPGFTVAVPGDLSAAAFPLVAAQIIPGSRVVTRGVGVNPTRSGLLEIARDLGAGLAVEPQGERCGEPVAAVHAWSAPLRAVSAVGGETVSRAIGEVPIVCALAARAAGITRISGAEALRREERDQIGAMVRLLRAFGVGCDERPDGVEIDGTDEPLAPVDIDTEGDHRIAMTAAVLALVARAPSRVRDAACIATSYPKFVATLRALGARIDVEA